MSLIHGYPVGLLSLLGSQNFGENPKELGAMIVPTVDLKDNYLLQNQVSVAGAIAVPALGFNVAITIPVNQVWLARALSGIMVHGAGVTADYAVCVRPDNGAEVPISQSLSVAANQTRFLPMQVPDSLWLTSGTTIGINIASLVGVPASVQVSGIFARLRP